MNRPLIFALVFTAGAAPLGAQGYPMGGGGMPMANGMPLEVMRGRRFPEYPKAKDLEAMNAASVLIDDADKLKLTPEQVDKLRALKIELYAHNADVLARYDAVRREYEPPKQSPSGGDKEPEPALVRKLLEQIQGMTEAGNALIANREADTQACLALLNDSQRKAAEKLLTKQTKRMRALVPEFKKG